MTPGETGNIAAIEAIVCEDRECEVCRRLKEVEE